MDVELKTVVRGGGFGTRRMLRVVLGRLGAWGFLGVEWLQRFSVCPLAFSLTLGSPLFALRLWTLRVPVDPLALTLHPRMNPER